MPAARPLRAPARGELWGAAAQDEAEEEAEEEVPEEAEDEVREVSLWVQHLVTDVVMNCLVEHYTDATELEWLVILEQENNEVHDASRCADDYDDLLIRLGYDLHHLYAVVDPHREGYPSAYHYAWMVEATSCYLAVFAKDFAWWALREKFMQSAAYDKGQWYMMGDHRKVYRRRRRIHRNVFTWLQLREKGIVDNRMETVLTGHGAWRRFMRRCDADAE